MSKLGMLADENGFVSVHDMIENVTMDAVVPGICANNGCDYTTEVEPDQAQGYCEECGSQTVTSCLILAGVL